MTKSHLKKWQTFLLVMKDGTRKPYFATKDTLLDYISVNDYRNAEHVEILNREDDTTKHRIIKLTDLK